MEEKSSIPFWVGPLIGPLPSGVCGGKAAMEAHATGLAGYVLGGAVLGLAGGLVVAAVDLLPRRQRP